MDKFGVFGFSFVALTKDDIEFIKYMKVTAIFHTTIWEVFASDTSKSIHATESKNENDTESKEDVKILGKQEKKQKRFCPENKNKYRYAWCAISGEKIDLEDPNYKKLDDNDPERLSCAHLIPSGCWGMAAIRKILNDGYPEKFDVHSPRNMVFCKGKYAAGMDARKISVEWTDKDGYTVFVDERFRDEYKDSSGNQVHGRKLAIYTHGKLNKSKSGPNWPYRRAFAWHLAVTQRRVAQIFQEMLNASMTANKNTSSKPNVNDA